MKYGFNLLLWSATIDESLYPVLENLKSWGYDGVELPVFDFTIDRYQKIGKKLDELELGRTAVTVCTSDENPISPDAAKRQAGLARLKQAIDACAAAGVSHLCGPIHSALGEFTGSDSGSVVVWDSDKAGRLFAALNSDAPIPQDVLDAAQPG